MEHLLRLSPEDRFSRFCAQVSDAAVAAHADALARGELVAVAAEELPDAGDPAGTRVRGLAEIACVGMVAEIALSLEPGWRGIGLSDALLRRAAAEAAHRGATHLVAYTSRSNRGMLGLARRNGGRVEGLGPDIEIVFEVAELDRSAAQIISRSAAPVQAAQETSNNVLQAGRTCGY